jgi:hypothetical protein
MIYPYRESLLSQVYPGNQHSSNCLQGAVKTFEKLLQLPTKKRFKTVWRVDGGFGADKHMNWLVERNYQVIAKGASHRRGAKLAGQVKRWIPVRSDKWVGRVDTPAEVNPAIKTFALRYETKAGYKSGYIYSTLGLCGRQTAHFYEQRGGAETEFRADKSGGLFLHKRRKHKRDAQEIWVILTDMVHNYLAWFAHHILADSPFAGWGPLRIGRDLFRIPGHVEMAQGRLLSVRLLKSSPYAADLLPCLARFWD